jgi:hypothetical protein
MNLELVAAQSFRDELRKIAQDQTTDNTKTAAAMMLFEAMSTENVESFLKEAGFGAMVGGIGRGLGALGSGAARGLGSAAAGMGRNLASGVSNAVSNVGSSLRSATSSAGQGLKGTLQNATGAIKALPGRVGQGMTNIGNAAEQKLTSMGQSLQQAGQARNNTSQLNAMKGTSAPLRPSGSTPTVQAPPAAAKGALDKLELMQGSDKMVNAGPAPAPPMEGVADHLQQFNPLAGLGGDLVNHVRGVLQNPSGQPGQQAGRKAQQYGTYAPA